jgi:hypothetical protein
MPLIIQFKLDEYGVPVLDQVIHGPGGFDGQVYVCKHPDAPPVRVEVLGENRAFREAISGVRVYSVPVSETLGWMLRDESMEAHIIALGRNAAKELDVYQDCYEDIAQLWAEQDRNHLDCYLRYTE